MENYARFRKKEIEAYIFGTEIWTSAKDAEFEL
jgi:hypothetical protein